MHNSENVKGSAVQKVERVASDKLSSFRSLISMKQDLALRWLQLSCWKLQHNLALARRNGSDVASEVKGLISVLENSLPNTGGFPLDLAQCDPQAIVSSIETPQRRRTSVADFDGFALDDALAFTNEYKHFSFYRLAKAIARIARDHLARDRFSVFELGCGGGDLGAFFRLLGADQYLGVDANPVAFATSPYILGHEDHFRLLNLQQEINFGRSFDLVCSFEVLEHIKEDKLDGLVKTIRHHMGSRSLFLGTASLQDNLDVHVTIRNKAFWLDRFRQFGLSPHPKHEYYERLLAKYHPFNWDASNTNVFTLELADKRGKA